MRIAAGVEYLGSAYCGWQRLGHAPSVQECVEAALARVADESVNVVCAGRTDTGVHASGQVIHFDTGADRPEHGWLMGTNGHLPDDIALRWVRIMGDTAFHARFSARSRRYRYVILNRKGRPALLNQRAAWYRQTLDAGRMQEAAQALLGEQDFSSFRAAGCQARHAVREIHSLNITRAGDFIYLDIVANAFLHHMVRNITGSLLVIGRGEQPVGWMAELLAGRDRTVAGPTAPAAGLYFVHVEYPPEYSLPAGYCLPQFAL
ncbi:MAG: tRNA pseudouridine(38-40) synthase TruA [Thiothrix sp.]|nr:tRNA pseudouridine(38-40) synthase TruA [Thiothrix sp.]